MLPNWTRQRSSRSRKVPSVIGLAMMLAGLVFVIYVPMPAWLMIAVMFLIGMGATSHMIAFSVGEDVASGPPVGTSSAFLNGIMFIFGGIMQNIPSGLDGKGISVICGSASFINIINPYSSIHSERSRHEGARLDEVDESFDGISHRNVSRR